MKTRREKIVANNDDVAAAAAVDDDDEICDIIKSFNWTFLLSSPSNDVMSLLVSSSSFYGILSL